MKKVRMTVCLMAIFLFTVPAFAENRSTTVSIDTQFGDEVYTNVIEVSWEEEDSPAPGDTEIIYFLGDGREGDATIKEFQKALQGLGYYPGTASISGSFDTRTEQAVKDFQRDHGLTVDGMVGPMTLQAIRSLAGSGSDSSGTTVTTENSYGRIIGDDVCLRASYSMTSASKVRLSKGTLLRISKAYTSAGEKWYYVSVNIGSYTHNGYVRSDMMEIITEAEYNGSGGNSGNNYGDQEILGMIKVTSSNAALRYTPSISAECVCTADIGDIFYYVDTVSGWFQTKAGYWIRKDYVKVMTDEEIENSTDDDDNTTYYYGDGREGNATIMEFQKALQDLGYYPDTASISGHFGSKTEQAVKEFQRDRNLPDNGVVDKTTLQAIRDAVYGSGGNAGTGGYNAVIYNLYWPDHYATTFKNLGFNTGSKSATLTDIGTGITFSIYVQSSGKTHADVEPLTAADTAKLCQIYGKTSASYLPYNRRAMVLTVGSTQFVCSIYPQPHGQQNITNNNFDGQFCVHFRGSTINSGDGGSVPESENHQTIINKAVTMLHNMTVNGAKIELRTTYP